MKRLLQLRVESLDYERWEAKAKELNISLSEYVRRRTNGDNLTPLKQPEKPAPLKMIERMQEERKEERSPLPDTVPDIPEPSQRPKAKPTSHSRDSQSSITKDTSLQDSTLPPQPSPRAKNNSSQFHAKSQAQPKKSAARRYDTEVARKCGHVLGCDCNGCERLRRLLLGSSTEKVSSVKHRRS